MIISSGILYLGFLHVPVLFNYMGNKIVIYYWTCHEMEFLTCIILEKIHFD